MATVVFVVRSPLLQPVPESGLVWTFEVDPPGIARKRPIQRYIHTIKENSIYNIVSVQKLSRIFKQKGKEVSSTNSTSVQETSLHDRVTPNEKPPTQVSTRTSFLAASILEFKSVILLQE